MQHEYTFLMYLTPDWEANNYGETAFFEEVLSQDGTPYPPGQQQYEWIASVRPRYGRIVIFRGIIPHSARPPSPGFSGARYTFACKVRKFVVVCWLLTFVPKRGGVTLISHRHQRAARWRPIFPRAAPPPPYTTAKPLCISYCKPPVGKRVGYNRQKLNHLSRNSLI